ncbi:DUF2897 family protein [Neptunicella marina]|uniref:DUF2897 family protein n=1 Tax=Neptunicella marina TaxID=2125989 RepID=A0A8J6LV48_9ALTE|nr:DUF2897 family protein [Neptunicella marina]
MSTTVIILVVVLIFGVIVGNLLWLKSTAKTKMPSLKDYESNNKKWDEEDRKDDDW